MTKPEMLASIEQQLEQLRAPAGYYNAGIPNFDHLFGRDACISALQLLHRDPAAAKATLEVLAQFQGTGQRLRSEEHRGKILHEHYVGGRSEQLRSLVFNGERTRQLFTFFLWRFPYYGSVDAGAWYLILMHHYYAQTGDRKLVTSLWPAMTGIVSWLTKHAMRNHLGLVSFKRHYVFGLRSQSWKDTITTAMQPPVAMVEVQGYYYYGLNLMAELADTVMGDPAQAEACRALAQKLRIAFEDNFVLTDGSYPLAIDGGGRSVMSVTSNPGHLLFTGLLGAAAQASVAERLMRDDMLTPHGLRNESMLEKEFDPHSYHNGSVWPFDTWVVQQGLAKAGMAAEAEALKTGMVGVFERWGNLPELYAVERDGRLHGLDSSCRIQAWSAGALINLLDDAPLL